MKKKTITAVRHNIWKFTITLTPPKAGRDGGQQRRERMRLENIAPGVVRTDLVAKEREKFVHSKSLFISVGAFTDISPNIGRGAPLERYSVVL